MLSPEALLYLESKNQIYFPVGLHIHSAGGGGRRRELEDGQNSLYLYLLQCMTITSALQILYKWVHFIYFVTFTCRCKIYSIISTQVHGRSWSLYYKILFYHFIDIAVVNAFLLHHQLAAAHNQRAKTQWEFREDLVMELADWMPAPPGPPAPQMTGAPSGHVCHRPMYSDDPRRRCQVCHRKTLIFCQGCASYSCFQATWDCFNYWHDVNRL